MLGVRDGAASVPSLITGFHDFRHMERCPGRPYNAGEMTRPRPDTVFRIGGLIGCGIIALPHVARLLAGEAPEAIRGLTGASVLLAGGQAAMAVLFGVAFWRNTSEGASGPPRRLTLALLAGQVLVGLNVSDYFFLIAAEVPFVFAPGRALLWLTGQLAAFVALVVAAAAAGDQVAIPEMAGMPAALAVPVTIVYLAGWQFFAFSVGYLAASEQRSRRELQQRARELLATQQMLADSSRVAERAQIARELHDTLGHSLTVLNVNLELARHLVQGPALDAVTKGQTVARMLLADIREVVHTMADHRTIDLRGALITLTSGSHSPEIHLTMSDGLRIADPARAHAVFRCVQEAITNAMRHARARHLWITVTEVDHGIELHIADDGRGPSVLVPGHGLNGMRERLEAADGWLTVHTGPGGGLALHAWVPGVKEPS